MPLNFSIADIIAALSAIVAVIAAISTFRKSKAEATDLITEAAIKLVGPLKLQIEELEKKLEENKELLAKIEEKAKELSDLVDEQGKTIKQQQLMICSLENENLKLKEANTKLIKRLSALSKKVNDG